MVIQFALLAALHAQSPGAVTLTVPDPPLASNEADVGLTSYVHDEGDGGGGGRGDGGGDGDGDGDGRGDGGEGGGAAGVAPACDTVTD